MIKPSRIIRDYQQEAGSLSSQLNLYGFIDEHTFLTKSGDLGVVLSVRGVDYECLDHGQLNEVARRFEAAMRIFDEKFRLYQYVLKRDAPPIPHRDYPDNPVLQEAITNRVAYLKRKSGEMYTLEIFFVILYEGARQEGSRLRRLFQHPAETTAQWLSATKTALFLEDDIDRAASVLANKVRSFVIQLQDSAAPELLAKDAAFRFLRRLLNFAPHKADSVALKHDTFLDYYVCDSNLECHRGHLRLDDYYVKVLTLKEPPAQTWPHILQSLYEIHSNCVIVSEWQRVSNFDARKEIQSKRRHFHNTKSSITNYLGNGQPNPQEMLIDDAAQALVGDLGNCLRELEVNGNYFGRFSMTVVLYSHDRPQAVETAVAETFKVFSTYDAVLLEERYNVLNAFLAAVPGNWAYNLRYMYLLNTNYADLSFLFTLHTGEPENKHLGAEYLAVLETNHGTPYFLNLHYQDRAHTIILGATGAGKSFFLNFLLTNLQKYQPYTFIFDLGGSYQDLTAFFNGSYVRVGLDQRAFEINPFCLEPTKENLHFLFSFVKVLIETGGGHTLTNAEQKDLYDQIENLYQIDRDQRRLFTLSNILPRHIGQHLARWVAGGQYATLFDNVADTLSFARFQAFDFEGLDKYPQVLEPLLFYVLHRANASIYSPELATTFKTFVMDEAWRFLRNDTIKEYITEALKTWRKRNAALIMATQSSDDLSKSTILRIIVESCATTIFLANPGMDQAVYRDIFHLNDTETALIADLVPKRQALIKRPDMARVVNLNVDDTGYWLYTNSPFDNQRKREAIRQHGLKRGLQVLAASRKAAL